MSFISSPPSTSITSNILSTGSTPGIATGAALGTGAGTPTIVGTNIAGKITFTTATLSVVAGIVFTMTFANSLSFPNGTTVVFTAGNSNFANVLTTLSCTTTTTTVVLNVAVGLGIATTYIGYYQCIGY